MSWVSCDDAEGRDGGVEQGAGGCGNGDGLAAVRESGNHDGELD